MRTVLAFLSHSNEVAGIVHAIFNKTKTLGKINSSHFFIVAEQVEGTLPSGLDINVCFHKANSDENNSGEGKSSLYNSIKSAKSTVTFFYN